MPNQVFLDTNILVYSRDEASPFFDKVMIGYNIPSILTLNTEDFQCFQEIKPITPDTWYEIL